MLATGGFEANVLDGWMAGGVGWGVVWGGVWSPIDSAEREGKDVIAEKDEVVTHPIHLNVFFRLEAGQNLDETRRVTRGLRCACDPVGVSRSGGC